MESLCQAEDNNAFEDLPGRLMVTATEDDDVLVKTGMRWVSMVSLPGSCFSRLQELGASPDVKETAAMASHDGRKGVEREHPRMVAACCVSTLWETVESLLGVFPSPAPPQEGCWLQRPNGGRIRHTHKGTERRAFLAHDAVSSVISLYTAIRRSCVFCTQKLLLRRYWR